MNRAPARPWSFQFNWIDHAGFAGSHGTYGLAAITERTLSDVDRIAIQNVYGPCTSQGAAEGRILNSNEGRLLPVNAAHIWLEELSSGRVVASGRTDSNGAFRFGCVPPATYRAIIEYLDTPSTDPMALTAATELNFAIGGRAFRSVEIDAH